jgi:arginine decarboxylase
MNLIKVTSGIGSGPTDIAAFDAALLAAGIANYNLIKLSSVIPDGMNVDIVHKDDVKPGGSWGDKLYVVLAEERVSSPNVEAWAGIGWAQEASTGKGLFVEHHGGSEATVRRDIEASMKSLFKNRGMKIGKINMEVVGTVCNREPVCALVVAVYEPEGWKMLERGPFDIFRRKK